MEKSESGATSLASSFMEGQYIMPDIDDDGVGVENDGSDGRNSDEPLREQDRFLPIANVTRIMKKSIPKTGKISKDARECVQECVSEFISFITSEASDRCHQEKRKTINGEDILFAMNSLGFESYVEPLKSYLQKYRESMKGGDKLLPGHEYEDLGEEYSTAAVIVTADPNAQQGNLMYSYPAGQFHLATS